MNGVSCEGLMAFHLLSSLSHVVWMIVACLLDDCCMSLGWSQYVSWMVTVCLLDGHSMSHPTYGRTTMGDVGMDQLPLHQMAFLLIAQCWDKH